MSQYPAVKIVILFIIGILFQHVFSLKAEIYYIELPLVLFLSLLLFLLKKSNTALLKYLLFIAVFLIAAFYGEFSQNKIEYPFSNPKIRNAAAVGTITELSLLSSDKLSMEIDLESVNDTLVEDDEKYRFKCFLWNDTTESLNDIYENLSVGNKISLAGTISRPKNKRNPGEFDYEDYLAGEGISGIINCYSLKNFDVLNRSTAIVKNIIFESRKSIWNIIKDHHSRKAAALLKGVLLADRSDIEYEIKESFINSGVIHVLAVSGLHVGFISVIFFLLLGRFDIRIKYSAAAIGILLFLILTGGHSSVFRASVMAVIFLTAKLLNRSSNGFNSLSIAAFIILLINSDEIFNPGFQLSFSAVLSILIIYPIFTKIISGIKIRPLIHKLLLFIMVSFAAQIGTLPFTIIYFNKLSIVSIFANLLVIPSIGVIVAIGMITITSSFFSIWLASVFAAANNIIVEGLYYFINTVSNISFSYLTLYNFSVIDAVLFYIFLSAILLIVTKFNNKVLMFFSTLLIITSFLNFITLDDQDILPNNQLSIFTIDVGQGDAIFLKFPNSKNALIDAGNSTEFFDNGKRVIYPLLQRMNVDKIDYGFVSHLDSDHLGGFFALIKKKLIDTLYKPFEHHSIKDSLFENYLTNNGINIKYYTNGIKDIGGCRIYLLNDTSSSAYKNFDGNNKSGIIKLVYGNKSFLFVGDAEKEAEEFLVSRYSKFLKADLLKVGHHGSKTSSTEELIDLVDPSIAVISAGVMNKFNHPSISVIERLTERNIEIMRTDKEGAVILCSDGYQINKINWR